MPINDCKLVELPRIQDHRGNLTFIASSRHIPFDIKRTYYLYDVPGGAARAAHGHKALHQLMIAMSGSFFRNSHYSKCQPRWCWPRACCIAHAKRRFGVARVAAVSRFLLPAQTNIGEVDEY